MTGRILRPSIEKKSLDCPEETGGRNMDITGSYDGGGSERTRGSNRVSFYRPKENLIVTQGCHEYEH